MADRTCARCGKTFSLPCHLRRHQARQTPCDPIIERPAAGSQKSCDYCGRGFASGVSLYRHVRQSCKVANSDDGMEMLMDHTISRQLTEQRAAMAEQKAAAAEQSAQIAKLTSLV